MRAINCRCCADWNNEQKHHLGRHLRPLWSIPLFISLQCLCRFGAGCFLQLCLSLRRFLAPVSPANIPSDFSSASKRFSAAGDQWNGHRVVLELVRLFFWYFSGGALWELGMFRSSMTSIPKVPLLMLSDLGGVWQLWKRWMPSPYNCDMFFGRDMCAIILFFGYIEGFYFFSVHALTARSDSSRFVRTNYRCCSVLHMKVNWKTWDLWWPSNGASFHIFPEV